MQNERAAQVRQEAPVVVYAAGECGDRPWGRWEVLAVGDGYVVKRILVNPGCRLSLQYHHHRAEHWTIVVGEGRTEIDGVGREVKPGDHIFIPILAQHRIANTGTGPMEFVEVQMGDLLDETDIVRLADDYSR